FRAGRWRPCRFLVLGQSRASAVAETCPGPAVRHVGSEMAARVHNGAAAREDSMAGSALTRLLAELRRRRVVRVAIVYAIAGWLVIQVAATVLPSLRLPEWTVTLGWVLALWGSGSVLLMAGMFDAGPHDSSARRRWCRSRWNR